MYVIQMPSGLFVYKHDGMNAFVRKPRDASRYPTREAAESGKVGHGYAMGGSGIKGQIVPYSQVKWLNDRGREGARS